MAERARGLRVAGVLAMRHALERAVDRQLTRESGLSAADYQLLVPLSEAPGTELRARDLGRDVDWERSRISHQIRRMEQRGLISRRDCPTDARGTVIALTEAGSAAIRDAAPSHVDWVRENFIDVLTPDEARLASWHLRARPLQTRVGGLPRRDGLVRERLLR